MFGRQTQASATSPSAVTPPSNPEAPLTTEPRKQTIPVWLVPWLVPLVAVLAIVGAATQGRVAVILGVVVIVGLGGVLFWATRGNDYSDLSRNDRFLKGRNPYEMTRNDRYLRDRVPYEMTAKDRFDRRRSSSE